MTKQPDHKIFSYSFVAIWILTCPLAVSQPLNVSFEHFNYEEGISTPVVKIAQDSFGFIWLGTMDGIKRFDGGHFVHYRSNPQDSATLCNNIINDLCVDPGNRIWAATNGGLCYFDFADGRFHTIRFDNTVEKIDRHRVHAVIPTKDGGVWFATKTQLHRWSENKPLLSFPLQPAREMTIKCLFDDQKNRIWIGTNLGVYVFLIDKSTFLYKEITTPFSLERNLNVTVHPVLPFDKDTFLIGNWYGGLQKIYINGSELHSIYLPDENETNPRKHVIKTVCEASPGKWWVGSYGNGLSLFDKATSTFTHHFHHNPSDGRSLGNEYIVDVFKDNAGILWVGTSSGLDKYDPFTQQFTSIPIPASSVEFSVYRLPSSILQDKNDPDQLWITVPGAGVFHYHRQHHTFKLYQHEEDNVYSLPDNTVYKVFYDDTDRLWIGMKTGLCLFDPEKEKFYPAPLPAGTNVPGAHIILQDKQGHYWFGTNSSGVYHFNADSHKIKQYAYDPQNSNSIPDNRIFSMIESKDGSIWIGSQNRGLCRLHPQSGQIKHYEHDKSNPASLPDNGVYDLYEDPYGKLWIATENGFAVMEPQQHTFKTFTTNDGLCNNDVFSILPDQQGILWLATNNGLSKFEPESKTFKNYYITDGLPTHSLSGAVTRTNDDMLYFGTTGMISYCRPEMMKINHRIPHVIITNVRIFDEEVPVMRDGENLQPIHLSYRRNMITLDFAALNFTNPSLNQYAYRLEGFDDNWIYSGEKQSATFTNLDGGTYTFRVKGANNDGIWNEEGAMVLLIVHPPFWKTWWFYLLCSILVSVLLFAAYRIRINQLLRLQQIRLRISRDLHDDIGSTLSSISMISSMAAKQNPEPKKAKDLFGTISSASQQAMELMSDIVWSINPKNDKMEMIITRMRQYASETLEASQIAFHLDVDKESYNLSLPIDKRKDFYLIFKEAINNLAKYSQASKAHIRIESKKQELHMSITDNGKGFDPQASYSGNGLKNMRSRAAQIHGELNIVSTPGEGTTIGLTLPLTP
ncbi:MAG TPA: two-component regulator propeller domain-containing protein [Saprospiraceae bacterium]